MRSVAQMSGCRIWSGVPVEVSNYDIQSGPTLGCRTLSTNLRPTRSVRITQTATRRPASSPASERSIGILSRGLPHRGRDMTYDCSVCAFPRFEEVPRAEDTGGGFYEICTSCGFEVGAPDDDLGYMYEEWRRIWIESGMPWSSKARHAPSGWDASAQLRHRS